MDELTARAVLVPAPDLGEGITTSIPRSEIEAVLEQDEMPIELVIDVTRFAKGEATDSRSVAVSWERAELETLLQQADSDEVILTFDREALRRAMDSDVEAHGLREKALILAVAATAAAGAAAAASAEPGAYLGAGAPIVQMSPDDRPLARGAPPPSPSPDDRAVPRSAPVDVPALSPDDRAVPRSAPVSAPTSTPSPDDRAVPRMTPVEAPVLSPDDRAVPRMTPVEAPVLSPDDRAVPRATPVSTPAPTPVVSPDDRAVPRATPVEAPVAVPASDTGITWAPTPAETAVLAGAIALVITGAFFMVGGRRRMRPGAA